MDGKRSYLELFYSTTTFFWKAISAWDDDEKKKKRHKCGLNLVFFLFYFKYIFSFEVREREKSITHSAECCAWDVKRRGFNWLLMQLETSLYLNI